MYEIAIVKLVGGVMVQNWFAIALLRMEQTIAEGYLLSVNVSESLQSAI